MEKKIYEKPELISVIDLGEEICEIKGESQVDPGDGIINIVDESGPGFSWDDYIFAKKSTLWDDEDEDEE